MRLDAVGYGAGDRTLADRPNLLRIVVGEPLPALGRDEVVVLEATIDDTSPQLYEHVLERLLAAGARDAFLVPVVMKKSRPGVTLRVLARSAPTATGWRRSCSRRRRRSACAGRPRAAWCCRARSARVETPWGSVRVKMAHAPDGTVNVAPEFEDCRALALARQVPLKAVHQAALAAACASRAGVTTPVAT